MLRLGLAAGLVVLAGLPARSEDAIVTLEAGRDLLQVGVEEILGVVLQEDYGRPRVVVTLTEAGITPLARFTMAHVKEEVVLKVCGQVVSRPTLWAPVLDGVFAIQGDAKAKAERLAEVLKTRDCEGMPVG